MGLGPILELHNVFQWTFATDAVARCVYTLSLSKRHKNVPVESIHLFCKKNLCLILAVYNYSENH